jgi:hypothetical protein
MALSPNYGWAEPDNSSLVKNGAQDIRALGDAIDTSVWNVGYGQAGKNKIINGDFSINQRSFTTTTAGFVFLFDRWQNAVTGGTVTSTNQTFTLGAAPVAGYEGKSFLDIATTGQSAAGDYTQLSQRIEGVRSFAGQTVTFSFWAKAASGTPKIALEFTQYFGTGGSPSATLNIDAGQVTTSTAWARYSVTVAIPSISGKTIGTAGDDWLRATFWLSAGSTFNARTGSLGIQNATISIWGVQVEYGSKMTPFQTASGGSIQGELAMCQRYYIRLGGDSNYQPLSTWASAYSTTSIDTIPVPLPVTMRIVPTTLETSTLALSDGTTITSGTGTFSYGSSNGKQIVHMKYIHGSAVLTQYRSYCIIANNSTSAYLAFGAEL